LTTDTVEEQKTYRSNLFERAHTAVLADGDIDTAARIQDLMNRKAAGQGKAFIAFCGLFSAGKSSLLNSLCQSQALATGAVPTTAVVSEIELPDTDGRVVLLDTPGVDSTDATHQEATYRAMHRADAVVIVMDYQHVEAEDNLELARTFTEQGKRLVLVVNQIDKHFDFELPFDAFVTRVETVLQDWDINYERLFFTTSGTSPHNQIDALQAWLIAFAENAAEVEAHRLVARLRELVTQHVQAAFAEEKAQIEQNLLVRFGYVPYERSEAQALHDARVARIKELQDDISAQRRTLEAEQQMAQDSFVRSVELAQIAPYDTTERGRVYVESMRPEFKVGWLGAKQKTDKEQAKRRDAFVDDLRDRTEKFLVWPLQNALRDHLQKQGMLDAQATTEVDSISVKMDGEIAEQTLKLGALVSAQYPYQYVKDVVTLLKRSALQQLNAHLERWFQVQGSAFATRMKERVTEICVRQEDIGHLNAWIQLGAAQDARIAEIFSESEAAE